MMDYAIKYAAMGFPVFPLYEPVSIDVCSCSHGAADTLPNGDKHSKGKHPRTEHGVLDATTDTEKVREWWTKWPNANIGIRTGNGIGVVDLDGPAGIASGANMGLLSPVVTLTGGGKHLWYRVPEGQRLITRRAGKLAEGVDTRGDNGYVAAPPSLHPSGKRYCWAGSPILRDLLPPLPTIFFEQPKQSLGLAKRNETGWIAEAIKKMQSGHVANTLVSVLGAFIQRRFTEEDTYTLLYPHALVDGKPYGELRSKIAEIFARYPIQSLNVQSKVEDIDQFLTDVKEVEWLCKPFIAKKLIVFVVGLQETLKTWLCIDLAVEAARGQGLWLGKFPVTDCKVLYIDQERPREETQRRFRAVCAAKRIIQKDLKEKLFIKLGTTIQLNRDESYQAFRQDLLSIKPDMVVVDSFGAFHSAPANDWTEMQKVLNNVKQLRDEIGCAFVFLYHENKNAYPNGEPQGEPHLGTMLGSSATAAALESALTVRKMEEYTSMIWHTKSTGNKKHKPFYASVQDVEDGIVVRALED